MFKMKKNIMEDVANVANLALVWISWLTWMLWSPHHMPLVSACIVTLIFNLIFLQALSGVVHEAAHRNFIQNNKSLNEFFGNWFAAYIFLYGLSSYRSGHFAHHRTKVFMIPEDGETAPNMATKVDFTGFLKDLCGITAVKMFLFRTQKNVGFSSENTEKTDSSWARLIIYFLVLWSIVGYWGSALMPVMFVITMVTIYPFSTRIRLWGTHADIIKSGGLYESIVARNIKSPLFERIFFGNRMMMYHYEHHLTPQLTFRECEKKAHERITNDINVSAPSYLFCFRTLLKVNRQPKADPINEH
jgi:fatty acid desaturase